jgi:hypothetical protein
VTQEPTMENTRGNRVRTPAVIGGFQVQNGVADRRRCLVLRLVGRLVLLPYRQRRVAAAPNAVPRSMIVVGSGTGASPASANVYVAAGSRYDPLAKSSNISLAVPCPMRVTSKSGMRASRSSAANAVTCPLSTKGAVKGRNDSSGGKTTTGASNRSVPVSPLFALLNCV